ncbi:MAG: DUF2304 domain-containing protein [Deltaproteobacteria bacterium]|nr:DUF2304 domain-containing protein [Deltaproteobacteria bacterium]
MSAVQTFSIIISLGLFVLVIDFIRRGLLKEKYSVLWIVSSLIILALSIWQGVLDRIAVMLGVSYAPSLLFLVALIFVLLILLHFSVAISVLTDRTKRLAQDIAILRQEKEAAGDEEKK